MAGIAGRKVAVLATDGVEQVELTEPVKALKQANAAVVVIALHGGQIQGMNHHDKGDKLTVDHDRASASAERFEALVLPGGVANPDALRADDVRMPKPLRLSAISLRRRSRSRSAMDLGR